MNNQFSNQYASQNDAQFNYQNQYSNQPEYQQPQQPGYQQPQQPQQPGYQQQGYQQPVYYQPQGIVVQTPVYSEDQLKMQEKIRNDQFGLIKTRGKLRLEIIGYLVVLSIIIIIATFSFFQLLIQGSVSGTKLTRFLTTEIYILNTAYIVAMCAGILSFVMMMIAFVQVRKVRVDSIFPFDSKLKIGVVSGALAISIVLFLSAFWLMMSLSTYWLFFLIQTFVIIGAMLVTFRVMKQADKIALIARKNNIQTVKKPVAESLYYIPVSYNNEVVYPQQQGQQGY